MKEDQKSRDKRNKMVFEKLKKDNDNLQKQYKDLSEKHTKLTESERDLRLQLRQYKNKEQESQRIKSLKKP